MDDAAALLEIEAIKQLKARYCRFLDTKDWGAWRGIFTDDFRSDTVERRAARSSSAPTRSSRSPARASAASATVHQVHAPEIELTSATTARGVWALEDVVRLAPGVNLRGYGHYDETYEKVDGRWLITSSTLTRLREDVFNIAFSLYISDRIKRVTGKVARRLVR